MNKLNIVKNINKNIIITFI